MCVCVFAFLRECVRHLVQSAEEGVARQHAVPEPPLVVLCVYVREFMLCGWCRGRVVSVIAGGGVGGREHQLGAVAVSHAPEAVVTTLQPPANGLGLGTEGCSTSTGNGKG